jgi:hypothetical protein
LKINIVYLSLIAIVFNGCIHNDTKQLINQYADISHKTHNNLLSTYDNTLFNVQQAIYYKAIRDGASDNDLTEITIDYSGHKKILADLITFTKTMQILTSDNYNEKIDDDSLLLSKSLKSLAENETISNQITVKETEELTLLINSSFKTYMEHERTQKLKELMLISDKWVQAAIDNLSNDLPQWKNILKSRIEQQKNIKIYILNNPYDYCKVVDINKTCIPLAETFNSKLSLYEDVASQKKRLKNLDAEFNSLSNSIKTLSKLHKDVINSLKNDKIDKQRLKLLVNELKEQISDINTLKNNIEKGK